MSGMIARAGELSQRLFPPIGPDLYSLDEVSTDLTPDQQVARDVLALANQGFTRWQRVLGWKLDVPGRMGLLLLHHRLAMAAELAGQWQRADFFWQLLHTEFKALSGKPEAWETLVLCVANRPEVALLNDPGQLRLRLVDEILIDTHCAFYNGQVQQAEKLTLEDRAFVHVDYIKGLLTWSGLAGDALLSVLGPSEETRLTLYKEARKWEQALQVCTDMLERFPDRTDYQDKLVELHFSSTLAKVKNGTSERENRADATMLLGGIDRLEQMRKSYPYNVLIFDMLGYLYHLRAIKLANGLQLADALVAVQKALTYSPSLEEAYETQAKLVEMMENLQSQVQSLMAELAQRPNATLNEQGRRMQREASRGFDPLNAFLASEAAQITEALHSARGRDVWQRIGLPAPAGRWDERARALLEGLGRVLAMPPEDPSGLAAIWADVAAQHTDLADLEPSRICTFLERRLFGEEQDQAATQTMVPLPVPPILTVVPTKHRRGGEPFDYWLLSRQDLRLKVQAAVAIGGLLVAGGLTVSDALARKVRDTAYHQIVEAAETQAYLGIIEGAEAFLAHPALNGYDERQRQVMDLYNEALVRWFVEQEGELDTEAEAHLKRYHTLILNSKR
jgi:hypothetical protein